MMSEPTLQYLRSHVMTSAMSAVVFHQDPESLHGALSRLCVGPRVPVNDKAAAQNRRYETRLKKLREAIDLDPNDVETTRAVELLFPAGPKKRAVVQGRIKKQGEGRPEAINSVYKKSKVIGKLARYLLNGKDNEILKSDGLSSIIYKEWTTAKSKEQQAIAKFNHNLRKVKDDATRELNAANKARQQVINSEFHNLPEETQDYITQFKKMGAGEALPKMFGPDDISDEDDEEDEDDNVSEEDDHVSEEDDNVSEGDEDIPEWDLRSAIANGDVALVRGRLTRNDGIGATEARCLLLAIKQCTMTQNMEILDELLTGNYNIDYMVTDRRDGNTALHLAIQSHIPDDLIIKLIDKIHVQHRREFGDDDDYDEDDVPYVQFNRNDQTSLDVAIATGASNLVIAALEAKGARTYEDMQP